MNRQDLFDRVVVSLNAAAFDDERWPSTSALLDELCETTGNFLVSGDGDKSEDVDIFFARFCYRGERHVELEREFFEVYHPIDERIPRLRTLPDSRLTHVEDLYTEEEKKASIVYNQLLPRHSSKSLLHARLDGPDGSRILWALADPVDSEGWTSARVETVGRLLPYLRYFVRTRQALVDARALGVSMAALLENRRIGVVQLGRRGRVVAANDCARTILRRRDGLLVEGGHLHAALPEEDAALQRLVARTVPFPGGPGEGGSMMVTREHAVSRLQLHASPVGTEGTADVAGSRIGALVLVIDPETRLRMDAVALGGLLGLTPAESHVAASLIEGKSAHDIAAETGRRVTTVKWHIRNIFFKHKLSGQADLVRLALSLADVPGLRR